MLRRYQTSDLTGGGSRVYASWEGRRLLGGHRCNNDGFGFPLCSSFGGGWGVPEAVDGDNRTPLSSAPLPFPDFPLGRKRAGNHARYWARSGPAGGTDLERADAKPPRAFRSWRREREDDHQPGLRG